MKSIQPQDSIQSASVLKARSEIMIRRGSALLIVIGTLALIAVFAAVYISIGRTDRRSADAVVKRKNAIDTSERFADYFANVVGSDRLDGVIAYGANSGAMNSAFAVLEATDVPYTDYTRRSATATNQDPQKYRFLPSGAFYSMGVRNGLDDHRVASDPWLAATHPTYLGDPGNPGDVSGTNLRPFSSYANYDRRFPNAKNFLDNRDWLQISNFAPDGRFVNLFNLRPNASDVTTSTVAPSVVGGFDAEPGVGSSPRDDGRQISRMSNYLSLFKMEFQDNPESMIQVHDPMDNGDTVWVSGFNDPQFIGLTDLWNVPAVWTMNQRFMHIPLNQPFVTKDRQGDEAGWASPDYPAYQYADADGNGFADSRWFELVAARDENSEVTGRSREDIEQLFTNEDYRYFIAARAIDLSSMINVNTATDLLVEPSIEYPMGLTPADVDLRRFLTMQEEAGDYTSGHGGLHGTALSYSLLHRPYRLNDEPAFGPFDPRAGAHAGFAQRNFIRNNADYWLYQQEFDTNDPRVLRDDSNAMLIGRFAYDALRRGIVLGNTPSDNFVGFRGIGPVGADVLREYERTPNDFNPIPARINAEQRFNQYRLIGGLNPLDRGSTWSQSPSDGGVYANGGSGLYGLDDLAELLTFFGINDPSVLSRLERTVDGRYESLAAGGFNDVMQTKRMGPLMSNRPLSLDRDQHGVTLSDINGDPAAAPSAEDLSLRDITGRVSYNSMAHIALSRRSRLTTLSGGVNLLPSMMWDDPSVPVELDMNLSVGPNLSDVVQNPNGLFQLYTNALAGAVHAPKPDNFMTNPTNWPSMVDSFDAHEAATLFYGHRGPELALRIAAHSAVNMKDLTDGDNNPTVATLVVDNQNGVNLRNFVSNDMNVTGDPEYALYPGAADGNMYDIGVNKLPTGQLDDERQIVNVYGFEAMPTITEVSVMNVYTDASENLAGSYSIGADSDDYATDLPVVNGGLIRYPLGGSGEEPITIENDFSRANADFLGQVIAFQLYNPFDQPISLGGTNHSGRELSNGAPLTQHIDPNDDTRIDTNSNYLFDFYFEYAGRFFKIAEYIEYYPGEPEAAHEGIVPNYYPIDESDPVLTSVPNPFTGFGNRDVGGVMLPTSDPGSYSNFITRNVVLDPGESRVFYVLADRRFDDIADGQPSRDDHWEQALDAYGNLHSRFTTARPADLDMLPNGFDRRGWTGPAEEWFRNQLSVHDGSRSIYPVMMSEFDPRTGDLLHETSASFTDLTQSNGSPVLADPTRNDVNEVRLWKKIVTRGEETTQPASDVNGVSSTTRENLMSNDMLVDRFSVAGGFSDVALPNSGSVAGTFGFPEDFPDLSTPQGQQLASLGLRQDNTGITFARWRTFRKLDSSTSDRPPMGVVSPWMIGSRTNGALVTSHEHLVLDTHDATVAGGDDSIFASGAPGSIGSDVTFMGDYEIQPDLGEFFNPVGVGWSAGAGSIIQTLGLEPHLKDDVTLSTLPLSNPDEQDGLNRSVEKFTQVLFRNTLSSPDVSLDWVDGSTETFPEIIVNSSNIGQRPRLADLLLPWGIGATYAPDPARATDSYDPEEWITPWESIGIALGFENPAATSGTESDSVWKNAYGQSATSKVLLDDGHLVIDDFVSYLNIDTAVPAEFDPFVDIPRGTGVPMALGVIDQARAVERIAQPTDPTVRTGTGATGMLSLEEQRELALSRPTLGTININTAPVEVLRMLPGLNPSRGSYNLNGAMTREWWGADRADTNLPDGTLATNDLNTLYQNPDVAAGIVAYRDRMFGVPNTAANITASGGGAFDRAPLNVGPTDPLTISTNGRTEIEMLTAPVNHFAHDRRYMTGIDGLRQTPGFGSLGEILAVRLDPELQNGSDSARWDINRHLMMDQYGTDNEYSGIDNDVTIMSQLFNGNNPGETVDDYAEKLAIANNVLATLSVRSDYFAVWFLVHGYQESDVANLRPEDPLVPTIRRRYLMVIDRTNVIEPGDQPKIVLMKELPL